MLSWPEILRLKNSARATSVTVIVRKEPIGVVAAIVPFNGPLFAAMLKVGPCAGVGLNHRAQSADRDTAILLFAGRVRCGCRFAAGRDQYPPGGSRGQ